MSEAMKMYEFLKALPPELRERFEVDLMKAELEKEVNHLIKTLKPGFGGKSTSKELDEYADEVYES